MVLEDRKTQVNDSVEVEATHLRIAQIVQDLYGRPDTDSDTVIAELAEHAAVEIPGAPMEDARLGVPAAAA